LREFPEFEHAYDVLSSNEDFAFMLADYDVCQTELQKLSYLHEVEQTYLQLKSELKEELKNYIISRMNSSNPN
jgi:hypothetical protein